ncbi:hypothetical protein EDB80DRAFT_869773 [Ilyonectria destructans]|nr:hypothetical protein EDB80DRAFT_869773 [Ilyonectria destructans]
MTRSRKIPRFTFKTLNQYEVNFLLSGDEQTAADGNLVEYSNDLLVSNGSFDIIIADEAQMAKNVSGTPISNSLRDLVAPLDLMWITLEFDWVPIANLDAAVLYHEEYDLYGSCTPENRRRMLNVLLVACGTRSLHYMSRNSQAERDTAVEHFNDANSQYSVLITSMQLAAFGVNFHKACRRGQIIEDASNLPTEIQ